MIFIFYFIILLFMFIDLAKHLATKQATRLLPPLILLYGFKKTLPEIPDD